MYVKKRRVNTLPIVSPNLVVDATQCRLLKLVPISSTRQCSVASDIDTTGRWRFIAEGRLAEMPLVKQALSRDPAAVRLLQRILRVDPLERPTASEILDDVWIRGGV